MLTFSDCEGDKDNSFRNAIPGFSRDCCFDAVEFCEKKTRNVINAERLITTRKISNQKTNLFFEKKFMVWVLMIIEKCFILINKIGNIKFRFHCLKIILMIYIIGKPCFPMLTD